MKTKIFNKILKIEMKKKLLLLLNWILFRLKNYQINLDKTAIIITFYNFYWINLNNLMRFTFIKI
jgi:hypothetical protein